MLGFLFGSACLVGLFVVLRRGHWGRGGFGGGRRFFLRRVFERLDTTPGQEKVIRDAVDEFVDSAGALKSEAKRSREDVANAMRGASIDETVFGELFSRQDDGIQIVRKELFGMLARVHDALDEKQRRLLADMIESGPSWSWRRHGPSNRWA